ncbi:MAG: zinc ribbon domain-containing protein [Candidatus Brocadiaceae bacterium]|nr:zinc ribbon domain-containing protein [Candidatus Brocadiaceae bacterium]
MPTYDYECKQCGHRFEAFQGMSDEPLKTCPECGKKKLVRLIGGGAGIIFRGSGFYITDYRNGSRSPAKAATGTAGSGSGSGSGSGGSASGGAGN